MQYAVKIRLRFIDFLVHQYGTINRSAITDYFGVSVPQASADLKAYMTISPDNLEYSKSKKVYFATEHFKRIWE